MTVYADIAVKGCVIVVLKPMKLDSDTRIENVFNKGIRGRLEGLRFEDEPLRRLGYVARTCQISSLQLEELSP